MLRTSGLTIANGVGPITCSAWCRTDAMHSAGGNSPGVRIRCVAMSCIALSNCPTSTISLALLNSPFDHDSWITGWTESVSCVEGEQGMRWGGGLQKGRFFLCFLFLSSVYIMYNGIVIV